MTPGVSASPPSSHQRTLDGGAREALLAEAEALVAQDRWLDAIDLLQGNLAVRDDPVLSQRLVQLRHSAFARLDKDVGGTWPPQVPDLFPDVVGIPEIQPEELN